MTILDSFRLDDKVVIVTGASSGLGVAFAQGFAEAGADVVLGARRLEKLADTAALVEAAGRRAHSHKTDVADPDQCQQLVDAAMEKFGRVDVLINNAGVGTAVPATRETPAQFRSVIDINLNGSYWMAQACGRVMESGSSIINIASVLGLTTGGLPQAAYSASKAGVMGLTRDLAQQWSSRKGIRVNALAPGFFASEMTDELAPGYIDNIVLTRTPMGRLGDAAERRTFTNLLSIFKRNMRLSPEKWQDLFYINIKKKRNSSKSSGFHFKSRLPIMCCIIVYAYLDYSPKSV